MKCPHKFMNYLKLLSFMSCNQMWLTCCGFWYLYLEKIKSRKRRWVIDSINPLNAELKSICHLLVLLEDLKFMGPCIVSIFQYTCISNKMQRYTVHLHLDTALHVSGGTSTHHQERIQLHLRVRYPQHTQTSSNSSTIAADSSNGVTNTRCCRYSCMRSWWWVEVPPETCRAVYRYK
jgi:hypothetical protein